MSRSVWDDEALEKAEREEREGGAEVVEEEDKVNEKFRKGFGLTEKELVEGRELSCAVFCCRRRVQADSCFLSFFPEQNSRLTSSAASPSTARLSSPPLSFASNLLVFSPRPGCV